MSVYSLRRRSARLARAVLAVGGVVAVVLPSSALAAHHPKHAQRLTIVRPYRTKVSGIIFFSVRGIKPSVRRIVFAIDGRRIWSAGRYSPRAPRATAVNTRKLRNGRHVLRLRVTYSNYRTAVVSKTIVVQNGPAAKRVSAHVASGSNVGAFGPPAGGVAGPSVAEFNRETYQYSSSWPIASEAGRYQFMVLMSVDASLIPSLKAINPNLKFLLYQAIMFTNSSDPSSMPTNTGCTPYADDAANHPSWNLHDQNGNPVIAPHSTDYAMDVGNPAYQQACAANAAALAKRDGFDGIFFDVVEGNLGYTLRPGITVPEYPNNTAWQEAMNSALADLGPAMNAQGLLAFGNVGDAASTAQWEQWVSHLNGVEEESWTDADEGLAEQVPYFSQKLAELSWAMANGKYEIDHSYNATEAGNTYGLASMLLAANGHASYATSNTNYSSQENWFPEYSTAQLLGAPAGAYKSLSNGVYERAFSHGIVLVNPTNRSVPTFSLGGNAYSGSGLSGVRSVAMPATSAVILLG